MVNIIANRHKAGVPRLEDNASYDLHYQPRDFVDKPWRTQMQKTNIFPVDTLHFPNGQWYWARIVSQVDDNTTAEGDLYLFIPGFMRGDADAGKAYGKWAEIHSYDGGEIMAYIGSDKDVPISGHNAYVLDDYEASTIDDAVAWVNSTMLDLVNEY